ncbi:MAG TPA: hypothetical protein VLC98_15005 [Phnomibacter sp.]|nr:hypothetical protein [Phnomibacter sp.]
MSKINFCSDSCHFYFNAYIEILDFHGIHENTSTSQLHSIAYLNKPAVMKTFQYKFLKGHIKRSEQRISIKYITMKQFIALLFLLPCIQATAQLDKGIWLTGGSGNLSASNFEYTSPSYAYSSDRLDIGIAPNIGYFLMDKFAVGLKANFTKHKEDVTGGLFSNVNRFSLGPFGRYYFLKKDNRYNILTDLSYQYGFYSFKPTKGNTNTLYAAVGTAIYFNTSVGLELLVGYYSAKEVIKQNGDNISKQNGLQISMGFQVHLEK